MTVEEVTELYIRQDMNLPDTAKKLNVNLTTLRSFMQKNNITKDAVILHKIDSAKKAAERWTKMNSTEILTEGD